MSLGTGSGWNPWGQTQGPLTIEKIGPLSWWVELNHSRSKETSFVLRDQDGALKYQGGEEEERKEHIL